MQDALDMVLCGIMCKKLRLSCVAMKDGYEHCACMAWLLLSSWLFFCLPRRGFQIRAESPQCSTLLVMVSEVEAEESGILCVAGGCVLLARLRLRVRPVLRGGWEFIDVLARSLPRSITLNPLILDPESSPKVQPFTPIYIYTHTYKYINR